MRMLEKLYDTNLQKDKVRILYDVNKFGEKEAIKKVNFKRNIAISVFFILMLIWVVAFLRFLFFKMFLAIFLFTAFVILVELIIIYYVAEKIELIEWLDER